MPLPESAETAPIRVLWLIKGLGPGGAERLLVSSAQVADHDRFAYSVAYLRADKNQLVEALEESHVTAHLLDSGGSRLGWLAHLRALMAGHDIVHAHSPLLAGVARLLSRSLPRSRRPVTVSTEHNVWSNFSPPTRILNAVTVGLDDHRWAVSGEVRRSMWLGQGKSAEVLVHGIVQDRATPTDPEVRARVRGSLGLAEDDVVAITVANLRREKDYPNLLRAAQLAVELNPHLRVLAVGQGPLEAEIRSLHHDLGLGGAVQLLGYRTDIDDLLQAGDLFVLASAFEGLPVSIMEAMSQGLPVVATAVGGVPEAVSEGVTGLLVPPRDHGALAAALGRLAGDPDLRVRLGRAGQIKSRDFDIRNAVARQQELYAVLAPPGRPGPVT